MKKAGVFLVILILFSVSASAFSLSDFFSGLFSVDGPVITGKQANPIKVYPGQSLQNLVAFEDSCGIESATAYFPFEGGNDKVEMILSAGNLKEGTYSASWIVHHTENMKWYKTKIVLVNKCGGETTDYIDWQDPTQNHPLDQVTEGSAVFATQKGFNFSGNSRSVISVHNNISGTVGYGVQAFVPSTGVSSTTTALYGEGYRGVWGETSAATTGGLEEAIYGISRAGSPAGGVGVKGEANGLTGRGVFGIVHGLAGIGVIGNATASAAPTYGVYGTTVSGTGVYGYSTSLTDATYGVRGEVNSPNGYAGYFTGGKGVRIASGNGYDNSSVGDIYSCIDGITPAPCSILCGYHGLTCIRSLSNDADGGAAGQEVTGWTTECGAPCVGGSGDSAGAPDIIACYCA